MTTVWLTQQQLDATIEKMKRINTHHDMIELFIPPFDIEINWVEPSEIPIYRPIHLLFRRKYTGSTEFELVTPIQVCEEWLAKQMQMFK